MPSTTLVINNLAALLPISIAANLNLAFYFNYGKRSVRPFQIKQDIFCLDKKACFFINNYFAATTSIFSKEIKTGQECYLDVLVVK